MEDWLFATVLSVGADRLELGTPPREPAIGEWAADAPQHVLARLGAWSDPRRDRHIAPDEATMRRVLSVVNGQRPRHRDQQLDHHHRHRHPAGDRSGRQIPARTFARTGGAGVHLLSALTHHNGTVLAQQQVTTGTSEITWTQPLLDTLDLAGVVVTADALHTTHGLARYLTRRDAHYVFTVKENQHRLHTRLTTLP